MIRTHQTRFGALDIDDSNAIHFPNGLIGFPEETLFVLLSGESGRAVSYLQSLRTPNLAFPVLDGSLFGGDYPDPEPGQLAVTAGLDGSEPAVLVIVAARGKPPRLVANMLAPIIVDVGERRAVQVVLDPMRYSANFGIAPQSLPPALANAPGNDNTRNANGTTTNNATNANNTNGNGNGNGNGNNTNANNTNGNGNGNGNNAACTTHISANNAGTLILAAE